jgi:hypothetical protein
MVPLAVAGDRWQEVQGLAVEGTGLLEYLVLAVLAAARAGQMEARLPRTSVVLVVLALRQQSPEQSTAVEVVVRATARRTSA